MGGVLFCPTKTMGKSMKDLVLFYLACQAEGIEEFRRFAASYRDNPAGCAHELFIIYKGFEQPSDLSEARQEFAGLSSGEVHIGDEHFDIGAYLHAAYQVECRYACFVNTHTEILSSGWLRHLRAAMHDPSIGMAGAHASFE